MPSSSDAESEPENNAAVEVSLPGNSVGHSSSEPSAWTLIGRLTLLPLVKEVRIIPHGLLDARIDG